MGMSEADKKVFLKAEQSKRDRLAKSHQEKLASSKKTEVKLASSLDKKVKKV